MVATGFIFVAHCYHYTTRRFLVRPAFLHLIFPVVCYEKKHLLSAVYISFLLHHILTISSSVHKTSSAAQTPLWPENLQIVCKTSITKWVKCSQSAEFELGVMFLWVTTNMSHHVGKLVVYRPENVVPLQQYPHPCTKLHQSPDPLCGSKTCNQFARFAF